MMSSISEHGSDLRTSIEEAGMAIESADTTMVPTTSVALENAEDAKKVLRLIDALDDHDDVQGVFANFDISEEILQSVDI